MSQRYLDPLNWNLRNICRCAENAMVARQKGGSPRFWEAEARKMDLDISNEERMRDIFIPIT